MTIDEYEELFKKRASSYAQVHSFTIRTLRAVLQDPEDKPLHDTAVMLLRLQADYSLSNKLFWYAYGHKKFRVCCKGIHDSDGDTAFIASNNDRTFVGFYSGSMPGNCYFDDITQAAQYIIAQLIINGYCNDD